MIKYQIIDPKHLNELVDELKSKRFVDERLGSLGLWFGQPARFLHLPDSVTADSLGKLLRGDFACFLKNTNTSAANQQIAGAFKLEIHAHPSLNALYAAAGPSRQEFIGGEHILATWSAVRGFIDNQELMQANLNPTGKTAYPIAAVFHSAATANQQPGLKTTAVFPHYGICRDGSSKLLDLEDTPFKKLAYYYESALEMGLLRSIGGCPHKAIGDLQLVGVPQKLIDHFSRAATAEQKHERGLKSPEKTTQASEELLHQWRREAKALGWGPTNVELFVKRLQFNTALRETRRALQNRIESITRLQEVVKRTVRPLKSKLIHTQNLTNKKDQSHSH